MVDDYGLKAIQQAERIVWAASWHLQEHSVLEKLSGTLGLCRARLEPRSEVIQLVTFDGEHLGHVRREGPSGPDERWIAVSMDQSRHVATCGSAAEAAAALARAWGKTTTEAG